jgi:hypothetical protein
MIPQTARHQDGQTDVPTLSRYVNMTWFSALKEPLSKVRHYTQRLFYALVVFQSGRKSERPK